MQLISIIIPTYNEAGNIDELLGELLSELTSVAGAGSGLESGLENGIEIIVVDGGSRDRTPAIVSNYVESYPVQLIVTSPGRAAQMNQGAKAAQGKILLFLHADSRLPKGFIELVNQVFKESPPLQPDINPYIKPEIKPDINPYIAGAFELEITGDLPGLRLVEKLVNCRSHLLQLPYGDQAIFLRAATFDQLGGFPTLPIMEDFQLIRQLQKLGKIAIVPAPVKTSPRRWQKLGVWQTTLINQLVILAFFLGIPPEKIANFYRRNK